MNKRKYLFTVQYKSKTIFSRIIVKYRITTNASFEWKLGMKLKFKTVRVCIFSYFHFGFEREHLYLSIPKRRSLIFLHLMQYLVFILCRRVNIRHPIPSFQHLHVAYSYRYAHKYWTSVKIGKTLLLRSSLTFVCPNVPRDVEWCFGWA